MSALSAGLVKEKRRQRIAHVKKLTKINWLRTVTKKMCVCALHFNIFQKEALAIGSSLLKLTQAVKRLLELLLMCTVDSFNGDACSRDLLLFWK